VKITLASNGLSSASPAKPLNLALLGILGEVGRLVAAVGIAPPA
jgi:hypothetical protein